MGATSIEWTDRSINPVRARLGAATGHYCEKVSAGWTHCYASRMQPRFGMPPFETQRRRDVQPFFDAARLNEVLRRKKPTRWFWCDMSDLFGSWVPDAWIDQCFAVMALTPQHTHQILTKRPERMRAYLNSSPRPAQIDAATLVLMDQGVINTSSPCLVQPHLPGGVAGWPLPNVWLGTSVEDQATANARIPFLLDTPAAVRFVSAEPLLAPVDFVRGGWSFLEPLRPPPGNRRGWVRGLDWVIVGGESDPFARPCDVQWIRSIVEQCKEAGTACFVKQLGAKPCGWRSNSLGPTIGTFHDRKGGDPDEWPADLRVRQFPKESLGW